MELTSIGAKYNKVLAIIVTSLFFQYFTSGEVTIIILLYKKSWFED
ncbi:hypothetical protein K0040_04155 [Terrisporobacter petrolearius]|nr:hypothetical protein [Terrisporobacter petrolearius]MCC3863505.1 hypothetical protein [Terrisporobacter petrolearius]